MTVGDVYTVAGNGSYGFSGDGHPATRAKLSYPYGVATDGTSFVFSDYENNRIRMVSG